MMKIDGYLGDVTRINGKAGVYAYYGTLIVDRKERFGDGSRVRTSAVQSEEPYHNGTTLIKTRNSTYVIVGHIDSGSNDGN